MALEIKGDSFAGRYKRVNDYAIDSTDVWDTLEDARVYARNTDTEVYVPYAGQIVAVRDTGKCYQLVKDDTVTEYPERQHFKLVVIGNANDIDDAYLSRDKEDTAKEMIHFMKGIDARGESTLEDVTVGGTLKSADYAKGSSGYSLYKDADGNYHLEIYYLDVRGKMNVETVEVKQSYHIKGAQWMTKASLIVSRVEGDTVYFNTRDADGNAITNDFAVGDFAYCKTFNLKENRMYWRDVTEVGADYIVLGAGITDTVRPGDSIVQLGNGTDAARQGATCLDTDSVKIYMGINTKSLPAPFIDLDPVNGAVIKAKFINSATGNDMGDDIGMLNAKIETVKAQTDKMYVIWFDDYMPTLANEPASRWTTDAEKAEHVEDMFYNTSRTAGQGGRAYRFLSEEGVYRWKEITDKDTIAALEQSAAAQKTADAKKRVFVSPPKDSDVYDIGDLWVNAVYGDGSVSYDNDSLVCIAAKAEGASFSIAHWRPVSTATTAYLENLGDRIIAAVSDSEKGLAEAKKLARQGIDDAYNAAQSALESLGLARSAAEMAKDAQGTSSRNTAAIQVTKDSIAALAQGIHFDKSGKITNINTSGLVTTEDFNVLLSKKVHMDSEGHITNISTSGLVTEAGFAQMFSERADTDGYVKRAEISTFVTEDEAGRLISNATIQADRINFLGKTVINGKFVVDEEGNVTMNGLTANNGIFYGTINADSGRIGGFSISGNGLTNSNEDGRFINDAYVIFRNDDHNCFAGIGGNILPASSGARGVARFENHDENDWWGLGHNYAMVVSAKGANKNTAIHMDGGCISGLAYKTINVSSSITLKKDVVSVACLNTGIISITLPDMDVCDDGHVIKIKRLNGVTKDDTVKIYAGNGYHNIWDETSRKYVLTKKQTFIRSDATNIFAIDPRILSSVGDAIELVYHRDILFEAHRGCWVEYKHPRDW